MQAPAEKRGSGEDPTAPPRSNRRIIVLGLLLCVAGAVAAAYLLGLLDRMGGLS